MGLLMSDRYRAWLLRTGELVFEARSGMWQRDCAGYVQPYPHHYRGTEMQPYLLPDGDELTQKHGGEPCADCWQLVEEKQELRDKLADLRGVLADEARVMRSAARQIELFMDDGERNRLTVALAILDIATKENR